MKDDLLERIAARMYEVAMQHVGLGITPSWRQADARWRAMFRMLASTATAILNEQKVGSDLLPITLRQIKVDGDTLLINPPLNLQPRWHEDTQSLSVEDDSLGLFVSARTWGELANETPRKLASLWQEYAIANPSDFSSEAIALRKRLRHRIERV